MFAAPFLTGGRCMRCAGRACADSRISEDARKRARDIRAEALAKHAERDRASLLLVRDEIVELKAMVFGQQEQIARLTDMISGLTARLAPDDSAAGVLCYRPPVPFPCKNARPSNASASCALKTSHFPRSAKSSRPRACRPCPEKGSGPRARLEPVEEPPPPAPSGESWLKHFFVSFVSSFQTQAG